MKKGLSVLCLLAMLLSLLTAMTVGTAAVTPSTSPDEIAKYRTAVYTETKPTLDGIKDAAYDKATPFSISTSYRGKVWMLWNAEGLYFYAEMRTTQENADATNKDYNVSNVCFYISGYQYQFPYNAETNSSWWTNKDGSELRGNYRFKLGWTQTEPAKVPAGKDMILAAPTGLEWKTVKYFKDDGTGSAGFDLEVFVPMKANDWDISKGAGQSYIGLGLAVKDNLWWSCGFTPTAEIATSPFKKALLPSNLEPVRLISDPNTTCQHEKTTYTITAPTLNSSGTEKGTCPSCGMVVTRKLPITEIQMLGAQTTDVENDQYSVRFVSQIATLENYSEVGYEITLYYGKTQDDMRGGGGYTLTWKTQTVFTSIQAGTDTETPREKEGGKYLVAVPVTDIPVNDDTTYVKFVVKPFVTLLSGETVYATGNGTAVVVNAGKVESVQLLGTGTVDPQSGKTLNLVWSDEFDGEELDTSKWNLEDRMWDTKRVVTTTDKKNICVENGEVVMNLYKDGDKYYSHKTLTTMNRMSFRYGYLEICAKVPFSQGSWPAFWLQSAKQHRTADYMTEVDVFEIYQSGKAEGALHKWELDANDESTHHCWNEPVVYTFPQDEWETLSDEYHRWGFGWTKEQIYLTVDGKVFATFDITDAGDFCQGQGSGTKTGMSGFQDPLFINFTNWIGTDFRDENWVPNENTVFPKTFSVKWVRLYQDSTGSLYNDLA